MGLDEKLQELENEVKLLKNEVHQTLLDIKDSLASGYQPPVSPPPAEREELRVVVEEPPPTAQPQEAPVEVPRVQGVADGTVSSGGGVVTVGSGGREVVTAPGDGATAEASGPVSTEAAPREEPQAEAEEPALQVEERKEERKTVDEDQEQPEAPVVAEAPLLSEPAKGQVKGRQGVSDRIDMATLVTLGNWADRSARKIGRERVETILKVYEGTGYLPRNLKQVLLMLLSLDGAPAAQQEVSLRECITVLLELNGLLVGHSKAEAAMLSLLVNGHNHSCREE